jgi:hypothetical protein
MRIFEFLRVHPIADWALLDFRLPGNLGKRMAGFKQKLNRLNLEFSAPCSVQNL